MNYNKAAFGVFGTLWVSTFIMAILGMIGWVMNIVQILGDSVTLDPMTVPVLLKLAGVVLPPLGGLMGWLSYFGMV